MPYTVRALGPADADLYRRVRLRALATDPQVFSSNLERERAYPESHWTERLSEPTGAVFGVFHADAIVGMTGVGVHRERPDTAFFWGSWLEPDHRGKGLSTRMYQARIDWARAMGLARVHVSHRASNTRSKAANQRHGFAATGEVVEREWPDGTVEDEVFYELML